MSTKKDQDSPKIESMQTDEMLRLAESLLANISSKDIPFSLLEEIQDLKQAFEENSTLLKTDTSDLSKQFKKSQLLNKANKQTKQFFHRKLYIEDTDKTRILISAANTLPDHPLKLDKELSEIRKILELTQEDLYFDIKQDTYPTYDGLQDDLLKFKPHIVHFSGHGDKEGIYLKKENDFPELISNEVMLELLSLFIHRNGNDNPIKLIIFNYCNSFKLAEEVSKLSDHCATIGMAEPILDNLSIVFSKTFYKALSYGRGIDFAFDLAKNDLKRENKRYANAPKLYT